MNSRVKMMRLPSLLVSFFLIVGCFADGAWRAELDEPLAIHFRGVESGVTATIVGSQLQVGNSSIENWVGPSFQCKECELNIETQLHMSGPTRTVTLTNKQGERYWVQESFQGRLVVEGATGLYRDGQLWLNEQPVQLGDNVTVNGCDVWVRWASVYTPEKNSEQSGFRTQLIGYCPARQ